VDCIGCQTSRIGEWRTKLARLLTVLRNSWGPLASCKPRLHISIDEVDEILIYSVDFETSITKPSCRGHSPSVQIAASLVAVPFV
jgi:hypothetical protein